MSGMYARSIDLTNFLVVHLFRHALFVTGALWICAVAFVLLVALIVIYGRRKAEALPAPVTELAAG